MISVKNNRSNALKSRAQTRRGDVCLSVRLNCDYQFEFYFFFRLFLNKLQQIIINCSLVD